MATAIVVDSLCFCSFPQSADFLLHLCQTSGLVGYESKLFQILLSDHECLSLNEVVKCCFVYSTRPFLFLLSNRSTAN